MNKNKLKIEREFIFNKYEGKCAYCGFDIMLHKFHVDHVIPKFRGTTQYQLDKWNSNITKGTDSIENYNPSCISCNISKSTFTIENWRKELQLKIDRIKRDSPTFNILLRFGVIKEINKPIVFHFEKL